MHRPAGQHRLAGAQARLRAMQLGFPALILSNIVLSFGPWMVRASGVGPVAAGFWRMGIAAPILLAIVLATRQPLPGKRLVPWVVIALAGLFFAADLAAWHAGIVRTRLANATVFGNITSFLFPIYGFVIARRLPGRMQGFALALAGAGVVLLMGRSLELSPRNLTGDALCIVAGILYTIYFIILARVSTEGTALSRLAILSFAGAAPLLLLAVATGERIVPEHWSAVVALSIGSQVIGQGLMIYGLALVDPLIVGLALLIQPIIGSTIGWLGYGERLSALDLLGGAMIAVALVLVRRPVPAANG